MTGLTVGVHDIPESTYHADPALSSTTARRILPPGCPALAHWERTHPVHKDTYDIGTVAHTLTLGVGHRIHVVDAPDWRSKAAQQEKTTARELGLTPILRAQYDAAQRMAEAVHQHPIAAAILNPDHGAPERATVWDDPTTGVRCRALLDWYPTSTGWGRPIAADLKTTTSAAPSAIAKAVAAYGYQQQADFYLRGLAANGVPDAAFLFLFVEKDPPHLVTVVELDAEALTDGNHRNTQALHLWQHCTTTGTWPGHNDTGIALVGLPKWARTPGEDVAA